MTQETAIGRGAQKGGSKTLTIEFETFGFFAGASRIGCGIDRILDGSGGEIVVVVVVRGRGMMEDVSRGNGRTWDVTTSLLQTKRPRRTTVPPSSSSPFVSSITPHLFG